MYGYKDDNMSVKALSTYVASSLIYNNFYRQYRYKRERQCVLVVLHAGLTHGHFELQWLIV